MGGGQLLPGQQRDGSVLDNVGGLAVFDSATGHFNDIAPNLSGTVRDIDVYYGTYIAIAGSFSGPSSTQKNLVLVDGATGEVVRWYNSPALKSVLGVPNLGRIYGGGVSLSAFDFSTVKPLWTRAKTTVDPSLRPHVTQPGYLDLELDADGQTIWAACACDSIDGQPAKALAKLDTEGNRDPFWLVNAGIQGYGISLVQDANTLYLGAGGNDFLAAYRKSDGSRAWLRDTSGSTQAVEKTDGQLVVGGHFWEVGDQQSDALRQPFVEQRRDAGPQRAMRDEAWAGRLHLWRHSGPQLGSDGGGPVQLGVGPLPRPNCHREAALRGRVHHGRRADADLLLEALPAGFGRPDRAGGAGATAGRRPGEFHPRDLHGAGQDRLVGHRRGERRLRLRGAGGKLRPLLHQSLALATPASTSKTLQLAPGGPYRFRVRATDGVGNVSAWSMGLPFMVDVHQAADGSLTYAGAWTEEALSTAYGGSTMRSSQAGDTATLAFTGTDVSWVARKGPDMGQGGGAAGRGAGCRP